MTPSRRRKSGSRDKPAGGRTCPSCNAAIVAEARFCHACGAGLDGEGAGSKWPPPMLAGFGAAAILGAVAVAAIMTLARRESPTPLPAPVAATAPSAAQPAGQPPDLSTMTPREAADRLFNRIMMASEKGDQAEALRFVPMALQAYSGLPGLDRDAHYHLGLIYAVSGDEANVDREVAALRDGVPDHLLALVLEHGAAERAGDQAAAARLKAAFDAAYEAEIAIGRREYEDHRKSLERFRAGTTASAAPAAAPAAAPLAFPLPDLPSAVAPSAADAKSPGAALFAGKCAICHGALALGSDKGPPLINEIYEPSHHDDASFHRAVRQGAKSHHWSFGDMAPVPGVSDDDVTQIIAYVRGLQRAVGIE